ncbi:MAG TPA: hypothetical protein PLD20_32230 [Blastocatellia bacterium]|nr:hypothetical protein [Blastocatellia bacterium]HMZ22642.1 hypothetical protein [Blastocatellia bacterium]HNG34371.1 hypothetical protein [Blastocatellia bacterium]
MQPAEILKPFYFHSTENRSQSTNEAQHHVGKQLENRLAFENRLNVRQVARNLAQDFMPISCDCRRHIRHAALPAFGRNKPDEISNRQCGCGVFGCDRNSRLLYTSGAFGASQRIQPQIKFQVHLRMNSIGLGFLPEDDGNDKFACR